MILLPRLLSRGGPEQNPADGGRGIHKLCLGSESFCSLLKVLWVFIVVCVRAGESLGNPASRRAEDPDGAVERAAGSQPQGGHHRVASDG